MMTSLPYLSIHPNPSILALGVMALEVILLWYPDLLQIKFSMCDDSTGCSFWLTKEQAHIGLVTQSAQVSFCHFLCNHEWFTQSCQPLTFPVAGQDLFAVLGPGLTQSGLPTYLGNSFGPLGCLPGFQTQNWDLPPASQSFAGGGGHVGGLWGGEMYQSIYLQEGKLSVESLWPNFNLTDNLKNQNQHLGHLECLSSQFNFTGIVLWLLIKCFILKDWFHQSRAFPLQGQLHR